ncbi:hypothetical protein [Xanthomonas arboricola]|uniref:hypothetical protein n=1 Tax=Xanthomonas arboricola TaxID=56448 RepID=UPI0023B8B1E9|nr:hypothetical protein [Xanthomonas arboricola]
MDVDEIDGSDILALVQEALARRARSSREAVFEVKATIDEALRQHDYDTENDREEAGAIALATLLGLTSSFDLEDYKDLLKSLNGTISQQIKDVEYVGTNINGQESLRLSKYLPSKLPRLQPGDRQAMEVFVLSVLQPSAPDPGSTPTRRPK